MNAATATYSVAMANARILIPLYAVHARFSPAEIGLVVSAQALCQLALRLVGGLLSDQYGERRVLMASFATFALGNLLLLDHPGFWSLIAAQLLFGGSRTVFWSASQSYTASLDPANAGRSLGRLTAGVHYGSVVGFILGGAVVTSFGYPGGFGLGAALAAASLAVVAFIPGLPRRRPVLALRKILSPLPPLLRLPGLYLAGVGAFAVGAPWSLSESFMAVYIREVGGSEALTGAITASGYFVAGTTGLFLHWLVGRFGAQRVFAAGLLGSGACVVLVPFLRTPLTLFALILGMSFFVGLIGVLYQSMAAQYSPPEHRAAGLAIAGLFWAVALLVVPSSFGAVANRWGLAPGFWLTGGMVVVLGLCTPFFFAALDRGHPQSAAAKAAATGKT